MLLFISFGVIALILWIIGYYYQGATGIFYPSMFVISLTFFALIVMIGIEYIRSVREARFFNKEPYKEITLRVSETKKVFHSKYEFLKIQRIIKNDNGIVTVEYHDGFCRFESDGALIIDNSKGRTIIDYEKFTINRNELLDLLNT